MARAFRDWHEIMELAESNPDQKIWCISMDGGVDFIMAAKEIKQTVGNYDWRGVSFGIINEDQSEASDNQNEDQSDAYDSYSNGKHAYKDDLYIQRTHLKTQFFTGAELISLQNRINEFVVNKDVIDIRFESCVIGTQEQEINKKLHKTNSIIYTAMIIYRVVEN